MQIADAIVIASPVEEKVPPGRRLGLDSTVVFRVVEVLKGQVGSSVEVRGLTIGRTRPSAENDIRFSHPEGHAGPCNRVTFAKSSAYILFLSGAGGSYRTLGYPFSRVSEDYGGEASVWTRVVRTYIGVQRTLPPMAQVQKLEEIGSAKPRDAYETALRGDIRDHLGSISEWKPTAFLLTAYRDYKAGKPPRYPPRDQAFDTEQSAAEALTGALMEKLVGKEKAAPRPRRSAYETRLLEALVEGGHPDAAELFEPFTRAGAPADDLALAIRFFANNDQYPRAFALIEDRAVDLVSTAPEMPANQLLQAISEAQQDPSYGDGAPRWRSYPASLERWPRLALKLSTISEARFGRGSLYDETLLSMLGKDYRADPDLTFALSGSSNDITDWALKELGRAENLRPNAAELVGADGDPIRLPLRITLHWQGISGDEDVPVLIQVFCSAPARRRMIFDEWGRIGGDESMLAILRLAAATDLRPDDREALARAIPEWDRRYKASRGESWLAADKAMQKLIRREPISAADIKPLAPARCSATP